MEANAIARNLHLFEENEADFRSDSGDVVEGRKEAMKKAAIALSRDCRLGKRNWFLDLDQACFLKGRKGAVPGNRFQRASCYADGDKFVQFRHPDAFVLKIRRKRARHILGDVTTHTAFFLGHTTAMDDASA